MSQHINIEDYLEPTDPPLPLPQISTFDGNNTINSTVTLGETMITQGYRIPLDIRHKTKNLFQIIPSDQIITETGTLKFTTDAEAGTITANGTTGNAEASAKQRFIVTPELAGRYYFSASFGQTSPSLTYRAYMYNIGHGLVTKWDGTTRSPVIIGDEYQEVLLVEGYTVEVTFNVYPNKTVDNIVSKLMLRKADTSPDFEPYYLTNHEDIYIGNSPLTQGQSITKAQSGEDVALFSGDNIIDTTLVNKPQVDLTYRSSVLGVGERTGNLWDLTIEQGSFDPTTGATAAGSRRVRTAESILLSANSWTVALTGADRCGVYVYDTSGNYIASESEYYWQALPYTFRLEGERKVKFVFSTNDDAQITPSMVSQPMLVEGSTPPTSYIPYGYQIPLLVTSGQQSTPHTIYIGDSPLTEGQSVSKTSSGTDIALYQGNNTISTTLGNKPEMKIDYLSTVVGVGERMENLLPYVNGTYTHNRMTVTCNNGRYVIDIAEGTGGSIYTIPLPEFKIPVCQAQGGNGVLIWLNSEANYSMNITLKNGSSAITGNLTIAPANRVITNYSSDTSEVLCNGLQIYCGNISGTAHMELSPMLVNTAQAPSTYIPYGYQIPIDIKQDDEVVDHKDIYIGTQPLVEGASVSKVNVGEDIALANGNNYIDTDLFNKPEMYIK